MRLAIAGKGGRAELEIVDHGRRYGARGGILLWRRPLVNRHIQIFPTKFWFYFFMK